MSVRDPSVDIAKGICMLFIIANHCGFGFGDTCTSNFNVPTFYFITGFFLYRYIMHDDSKYYFIYKKFRSLMVPYFVYNILFAILTYILSHVGVYLYKGDLPIFSVHNMLVEPFFSGHHFEICCAMWFVPSLFLVMLIICISKEILHFFICCKYRTLLLIGILFIIYYCSVICEYDYNKYIGVISRTFIGFSFCILGCIYYKYKKIVSPECILFISITVYTLLQLKFGPLHYSSVWNIYGVGWYKLVALPTQVSGVLFVIALSELIHKHNSSIPEDIFAWFGKNSFHVMSIHLSGLVVFNIVVCTLTQNALSDINSVFFKFKNIYFMYLFFCIFYCYFTIKYAMTLWCHIKYAATLLCRVNR